MKTRLVGGVVGAFVLLALVGTTCVWLATGAARSAMEEQVHRSELLVARERSTELSSVLDRSRDLATSAASRPSLGSAIAAGDVGALQSEMQPLLGRYGIVGVDVWGPDDEVIASFAADRAVGDPRPATWTIPGVVPTGGRVEFTVDLDQLVPNLLAPLGDLPGNVTLADTDGRVLLSNLPVTPASIASDELRELLGTGGTTNYHSVALDERRIASVVRVAGQPLSVIVSAPATVASGPATELVERIAVVVVGASVVAGLILGVLALLVVRNRRRLELSRATAELLANTDPLTGLANRRGIQAAVLALGRPGAQLGLLLVDLDGFKRLNDELGHVAGDRALRSLAHELASGVRPGDVVGRWGGDEFVLLVPPGSDVDKLVERVRAAVARVDVDGRTLTASIGVAVGPADLDALLERADAALYREKYRIPTF